MLEKMVICCLGMLRRYGGETAGATAVVFALAIPVLVTSVGMAVDVARIYLAKERLSHALDAAALAAASSSHLSESERKARAEAFFYANFKTHHFGSPYELHYNPGTDNRELQLWAESNIKTTFLRLLGVNEVTITEETTVRREVRVEVALVLDVTGSMASGNNIGALRDASEIFVDTLYDRVTNPETMLKIGLVPYAATVNIGSIAPDYAAWPLVEDRPDVEYDTTENDQWHGCVMAREYPHDTFDTSVDEGGYWKAFWWEHTSGDFKNNPWDVSMVDADDLEDYMDDNNISDPDKVVGFNLPYNKCNDRRTPNLGCPMDNPIVPLTSDRVVLEDAIDDIVYWCRGGTLGNLGLTWGWRVLSPEEPFTEGSSYDDKVWRKAVVMMTDGQNQLWKKPGIQNSSDYSAYGYIEEGVLGTTSRSTGLNIVNGRFAETCEAMKEKGITIYTVVFSSSVNQTTKNLYKDCASDSTKYYDAPSQDDLRNAFGKIADELGNLYIKS